MSIFILIYQCRKIPKTFCNCAEPRLRKRHLVVNSAILALQNTNSSLILRQHIKLFV